MNVVVLGPGALGCVFGAALFRSGHDVTLLGRSSPHLDALRASGLRLERIDGTVEHLAIPAAADPRIAAKAELILVLVKAADTSAAARAIAPYAHDGQVLLTLQNGLGNAERIRAEAGPGSCVLSGVTSQGATRLAPGSVRHAGEGPTVLGGTLGNGRDLSGAREIAAVLTAAGLPAAAVPDIAPWIWRKLAVNAAINGLTALAGVKNGMIASDTGLLGAAEIVAEEAAAVARAQGWELGGMREQIVTTAVATAENRSSMLQDLDAGRPTEVGAIHESILAAGQEAGVGAPATAVLAALIRAREQARQEAGRRS